MANGEFGMMDGAYFVSRSELLQWMNEVLGLSYTKVEQCCSGIAHVQILDALFPGTVPLHKVNFNAKLEHEYISNLKVLQTAFSVNGIKKVIEIERLVKGRYQDNLEFLQWMKRFADARMPQGLVQYDAAAAREQAVQQQRRMQMKRGERGKVPSARPRKDPPAGAQAGESERPRAETPPVATATTPAAMVNAPPAQPQRMQFRESPGRGSPPAGLPGGRGDPASVSKGEARRLRDDLEEARLVSETLEQERDFYYNKLREIELLCKDEANPLAAGIRQILFATSDAFCAPADEP